MPTLGILHRAHQSRESGREREGERERKGGREEEKKERETEIEGCKCKGMRSIHLGRGGGSIVERRQDQFHLQSSQVERPFRKEREAE